MEFLHATRVLAEFLRVEPINTMEVWVYTYKKPAENPAFVRCGCPNQRRDVQKLRRCPVQPGRPSSSGPAPVGIQPLGCPRWPTAPPRVLAVVPAPARHDPEAPRQIDVAGVDLVGVPHQEAPKGPLRHVVALAHGRPGKASVGIGAPQCQRLQRQAQPRRRSDQVLPRSPHVHPPAGADGTHRVDLHSLPRSLGRGLAHPTRDRPAGSSSG